MDRYRRKLRYFPPYVLRDLPVNLWGIDILRQLQIRLTNEHMHINLIAFNILVNQGSMSGKGLGTHSQGISEPMQAMRRSIKEGLGFQRGPLSQ